VVSNVRGIHLTLSIDDAWREAERIVAADPTPEARRWFEIFSRMDGLLRQIAELPFVKDDPTSNRIFESFATCETMEDLFERIDRLVDHVQSLFRAKMLAEGRDPGPARMTARRGPPAMESVSADDSDAVERPSRNVLKL
jgi:hypothetical protein